MRRRKIRTDVKFRSIDQPSTWYHRIWAKLLIFTIIFFHLNRPPADHKNNTALPLRYIYLSVYKFVATKICAYCAFFTPIQFIVNPYLCTYLWRGMYRKIWIETQNIWFLHKNAKHRLWIRINIKFHPTWNSYKLP